MNDGLPVLDRPLGSLDFRLRWTGAADGTPFAALGRRARAEGTGTGGVDALWAGDVRVLRTLRLDGASAREVMETPLGVERRLVLGTTRIVERVVVHHDAPVAWVEWVREPDSDGNGGTPFTLALSWRTGLDVPGGATADPPGWERLERGVVVHRGDPAVRGFFILNAPPSELTVEAAEGDLLVRARCPVPDSGLRMAVVGAGSDDDPDRLLRIAGRTRVAVRGREGGANRLLDRGIVVTTPDPALDRAVATARLRLDAAGLPPSHGVWRTEDAVRTALAHLVTGDFGAVLGFLQRLARVADNGRVPDRVLENTAVSHDDGRAGLLFLLLTARYLAWSGDLDGVRGLRADTEAVLRAMEAGGWPDPGSAPDARGWPGAADAGPALPGGSGQPDGGLRDVALAAAAVAAEEIGESEMATELRRVTGDGGSRTSGARRGERNGASRPGAPVDPAVDPAGVLLSHVGRLLAPDPDAARGRLELRPRPPAGWERYEVRGLPVGSGAVGVAYRRDGRRHRFELEQTRGPAPLQVVLAPELPGGEVIATRVDRKPAALDVERAGDRLRVPVQLVLDRLRTLEVEFADDTP